MEERGRDRLTSGVWERALKHGDDLATRLIDRAVKALGADRVRREPARPGGCDHRRRDSGFDSARGGTSADRDPDASSLFVPDRPPPHMHVATLGDLGGADGAALLVDARVAAAVA